MSHLARVGYEGQRYLVGAWAPAGEPVKTFEVMGWTNDEDGGALMRSAILNPRYENPVVKPVIRVLDYEDGWWMEYVGSPGELSDTISFPKDGRWQFNGDTFNPTFTPSMLEDKDDPHRRHYIVTKGVIEFCSDCADRRIAGRKIQCDDVTVRAWANGQGEPA